MEDDDIINDLHSSDEVEADKRAKKVLLLETITKNCASSPHEILQKINTTIHSGDGSKLDAEVLCGGATNYSFKTCIPSFACMLKYVSSLRCRTGPPTMI